MVKRPPKLEILDTLVVEQRTGTDGMGVQVVETIDYERLDQPAVMRKGRGTPSGGSAQSFDPSEIPAFLRKQAD